MVQLISVTPETHRAYVELTCPLTRPEVNALNAVCVLLRCACARPVTKKKSFVLETRDSILHLMSEEFIVYVKRAEG